MRHSNFESDSTFIFRCFGTSSKGASKVQEPLGYCEVSEIVRNPRFFEPIDELADVVKLAESLFGCSFFGFYLAWK